WRHILFSGDRPMMVIDLVTVDGRFALRKASIGRCVEGIDRALRKLASEEPAASEIKLLQVPCLDIQAVSYRTEELGQQVIPAYSVFPEFAGLPVLGLEDFVSRASERAVNERVTSHV